MQQHQSDINHVMDDPIDKNTASHAVPNIREPSTAFIPISFSLLFTSVTSKPYTIVTMVVAATIRAAES